MEIENLLTNIVKERGVAKMIVDMKCQIETTEKYKKVMEELKKSYIEYDIETYVEVEIMPSVHCLEALMEIRERGSDIDSEGEEMPQYCEDCYIDTILETIEDMADPILNDRLMSDDEIEQWVENNMEYKYFKVVIFKGRETIYYYKNNNELLGKTLTDKGTTIWKK